MKEHADFVYENIKKDLIGIGHNEGVATSIANAARNDFINGSNWKMGAVFATLQKQARKRAGKAVKKAGKK